MDWLNLIQNIFEACVVPLLTILTGFLIKFIRAKAEELKEKNDNDIFNKYICLLENTITSCVIATNQTYVDALKQKNAFDMAAQKEAFRQTYEAVMAILTTDAKVYLNQSLGDLESYVKNKIEAEVNINKCA